MKKQSVFELYLDVPETEEFQEKVQRWLRGWCNGHAEGFEPSEDAEAIAYRWYQEDYTFKQMMEETDTHHDTFIKSELEGILSSIWMECRA